MNQGRRPFIFILALCAVLLLANSLKSVPVSQAEVPVPIIATKVVFSDALPKLNASAYGIFDAETGEVLSDFNGADPLPIASVTKLFSGAATLSVLEPETRVVITSSDEATLGRAGRLKAGEEYSAYDLVFPLILESSNDGAVALERASGGEVIEKMNEFAQAIGLSGAHFADASGLSDRNQASVRDLATLTTKLLKEEPHIFDISRLSSRAIDSALWANTNPFLSPEYRGGKHGYTEAAGRTAVALFEEELGNLQVKRVLGYVVLGSADLKADMTLLRTFVSREAELQ